MEFNFLVKIGFEYIKILTECYCPYGQQLVKRLSPLKTKAELYCEYDNIEKAISAKENEHLSRLCRLLMSVKDIRRSIEAIGEGALTEVELFELKRYTLGLREIKKEYTALPFLFEGCILPDTDTALDILCIDGNCEAGFYITDSYSPELKQIRTEKREVEQKIRLAQGREADELKLKRLHIVERETKEEARIRKEISEKLVPFKDDLLESTHVIGKIDFTLAKARCAVALSAVRPQISDGCISMSNMQNPYVEKMLREKGRTFTPVSIHAESGSTVITGANMGGKSIALKTLALNCCAAICGMFVFCESASLPVLDDIIMIAEDSEDTENGLSSFGGEMIRMKDALRSTDKCCLLLFDEPARGTNPQEGAKIVRAIVKYLNSKAAISVFATHYDGIAKYAKHHYRVIGLRDFDFDSISHLSGTDIIARNMNYGLYEAPNDDIAPREAIGIAKLLLQGEPVLDAILREE